MHLLFLSTVYPDASQPTRGTYNAALCRALAEQHAVHVISPRSWREYWPHKLRGRQWQSAAADSDAGIAVDFLCYYYPPGFQSHRYGAWMWRSVESLVERRRRERPIDAVLSYWAHPDGDAALQAAHACGVPSAVLVGGSDVLLLPKHPKRRREVQRVLRETDLVLAVSDGLRRAVIDLGIDSDKVHTVYQGTETASFHPGSKSDARRKLDLPADADVLLWVGRMVDVKRLDVLLEAFRSVASARPAGLLCLVGSGPLRAECERTAREAGIAHRVHFVGNVTPAALGDWYRAADLTVLSSDSEGLPNVLRESLACGTPYVTTDVGDIREIDRGRWGIFVRRGDAAQLSAAIIAQLDGSSRLLQVTGYVPRTWQDMAQQVTGLFAAVHHPTAADKSTRPAAGAASAGSRTAEPLEHNLIALSSGLKSVSPARVHSPLP